jgi:hypothetical protein
LSAWCARSIASRISTVRSIHVGVAGGYSNFLQPMLRLSMMDAGQRSTQRRILETAYVRVWIPPRGGRDKRVAFDGIDRATLCERLGIPADTSLD